MRYKQLGATGTLVSEICLGTMTFDGRGFWTAIGVIVGAKTIEQLDLLSALPHEYPRVQA